MRVMAGSIIFPAITYFDKEMMVKKRKPNKLRILKHPHPGLDIICDSVDFDEWGIVDDLLVIDMIHTMERAEGIGLAASQVGVYKRILVMKDHNNKIHVWINPEIDRIGPWTDNNKIISEEGCLSCPGVIAKIERYETIVAKGLHVIWGSNNAYTYHTEYYDNRQDAVTFQHETDHLDGITLLNNNR